MHLAPLLTLFPLALSLPNQPRAAPSLAPQILEQINVLNSSLATLTTAVNAFDGKFLNLIPQSLAVITAETTLDATTLKTTFITKLSGNFTVTESNLVVGGLAELIAPIQASLTALTTKVSRLQSGHVRNLELMRGTVCGLQEGAAGADCIAGLEDFEGTYG